MDQQKLRTLVFEKTGVRIDIDDPVFALVALNEAVLAEAVERHVALLDDATADLEEQLASLQERGSLCRYDGDCSATPAPVLPALVKPPPAPSGLTQQRVMAIAGGAAVLCAVLVLAGQALLLRPAPAPPQLNVAAARELTPEQSAALRDAEKLNRIVQKLDARTRSMIQADMAKP